MIVKDLYLWNFRNYKEQKVEFSDDYNIIYGENGQGKTNIIESIYFISTARSHRASKDSDMINYDSDEGKIKLNIESENNDKEIEIVISRNQRKKIKINDISQKKLSKLIGNLQTVLFSPEDLSVIKEGPSMRRRYVDICLSQLSPSYINNLIDYNRILLQKNAYLKDTNIKKDRDLIDVWNKGLAEKGTNVIIKRIEHIEKMNIFANKSHLFLTGGKEYLKIEYESNILKTENAVEEIKEHGTKRLKEYINEKFEKKLKELMDAEIIRKTSLAGIQRDDYLFFLNDMDAKIYGSQGQQRTAVLSLKMAEIDIIKDETGSNPVLLLDDVMSELDGERRGYLLDNIKKVQTFITCTDRKIYEQYLTEKSKFFKIESGQIV